MKLRPPHAILALALLALSACGGSETASPQNGPFDMEGKWLFLGPGNGPHDLTVTRSTMFYEDVEKTWSSTWTLTSYNNTAHGFRVTFASGTGTYFPVGKNMVGTYDVTGTLLSVQLASGTGAYPALLTPGTCTSPDDGAPLPDCRIYVHQN